MTRGINNEIENCRRKRRFGTEAEARDAASRQMRMHLEAPDLDVYECLWCGGWHLTAKMRKSG